MPPSNRCRIPINELSEEIVNVTRCITFHAVHVSSRCTRVCTFASRKKSSRKPARQISNLANPRGRISFFGIEGRRGRERGAIIFLPIPRSRGAIVLIQLLIRQRYSRRSRGDSVRWFIFLARIRFDYSGSPQDVIRVANDFSFVVRAALGESHAKIRKLRVF